MALSLFPVCASFGEANRPAKQERGVSPDKENVKTRDQLLSTINAWLRRHHEAEWTMDELIGRTVDESYSFGKGDNPIWGPIEDFLVCLIKDKPFNRALRLRRTESRAFRLVNLESDSPSPPHYSLAVDILATDADLQKQHDDPRKADHWRIALATAFSGRKSVRKGPPPRLRKSHEGTPQQVLASVNLARRKHHLPDFSRDELVAVLSDKLAVMDDYDGPVFPVVTSFFRCFLNNKRFKTQVRVQGFLPVDGMTAPSTNERLSITSHESIDIDVLEPVFPDSVAVLPLAHILVSHYTPKTK